MTLRRGPLCLFALTLGACSKTPVAADASAPSSPSVSAAAVGSSAPASPVAATAGPVVTASDVAWLPKPDFGARGPIRVKGFSRSVSTGMNDPAERAGYSKDGSYFGYCASIGAREPDVTTCEFTDRSGRLTKLSSEKNDAFDSTSKKALDAWLDANAIPRITKGKDEQFLAPALAGDWDFASEIELVVDARAQGKKGAMIRLGGSVRGEEPVFSIPIDHTSFNPQVPFHTAWINALALSPDGRELGIVGGFFCMEWCDAFEVRRIPTVRFAAMVFNDTGMRHHEKKDFVGSAALFTKAVHADPTFPIAAYNLACALARTNDPKTKDALQFAIRAGGEGVKARAKTDADFAAVRGEAFFKDLVEP